MAWAGAIQEGSLQERSLQERSLQEGLGGSLNLLRLGWLSLPPRILVVGTSPTIMKSITGRSDGSARLFLEKKDPSRKTTSILSSVDLNPPSYAEFGF